MLQNARVAAFTISELLRENQDGVKLPPTILPTQIRVKSHAEWSTFLRQLSENECSEQVSENF